MQNSPKQNQFVSEEHSLNTLYCIPEIRMEYEINPHVLGGCLKGQVKLLKRLSLAPANDTMY